jgi:CheY-like chemotaxis protein
MADWSRTTPEAFLESYRPATRGIVMVDAMMPGMGGWALMDRLRVDGYCLPAILITGQGDVGMAVRPAHRSRGFHREADQRTRAARQHRPRLGADTRFSQTFRVSL